MHDELAQLRRELTRLRTRVDELESERDELAADRAVGTLPAEALSRRNWMKAAAAAAVGGTAVAVATSQPAAAANNDPMRIAQTNTGTSKTTCVHDGGTGTDDAGWEFRSTSTAGLRGDGETYGVEASGNLAAVNLVPTSADLPTATNRSHRGGELYARAASGGGAVELWYCTVGGTPGSWTQLAGPFVAGGFSPVTPSRVYDSRIPQPDPGTLGGGSSRIVDISRARDLATGGVVGTVVPEGALAISFNVTIVNTVGAGFLEVAPSFTTTIGSSTINWSANGQVVANGSISSVGNDRRVKVSCGGAGSTDFLIDVTGYWA